MKLFVFAALVAAASAARLEHLERSYLPPDNNAHGSLGNHGGNGLGSGNNRFGVSGQGSNGFEANSGSNGFGANGGSNGFGANSGSNGFGANGGSKGFGANSHSSNRYGSNGQASNGFRAHGQISNGFGSQDSASNRFGSNGQNSNGLGSNAQLASHGSNGFGSSQGSSSFGANGLGRNAVFGSATSKQYLPPNHGPSGSNGFNNGESSIKPACISCGSHNQYNQGSQAQIPSSNYGVPQLGSRSGSASSNDFGSSSSSEPLSQVFGSPSGSEGHSSQPQFGAASRQYLAPKYSPSQSPPQQPFDENSGYIY